MCENAHIVIQTKFSKSEVYLCQIIPIHDRKVRLWHLTSSYKKLPSCGIKFAKI